MILNRKWLAGGVAMAAAVAGCSGAATHAATVVAPGTGGGAHTVAVVAPAAAGTADTAVPTPSTDGSTITASGEGRASGPPDLLVVTLGVQTSGDTARAALSKSNDEATALIDRIEADGVAAPDVQTSQLSLQPVYADASSGQAPRITGYSVSDMVTVKIRHLDRAGTILDDAVTAGGTDTQLQSMGYSVSDAGPLLAAAHAQAVQEAVAEARAMATAAGVTLGPLRAVSDVGTQVPEPMPMASAAMPSAAASVPVQAGTEDVTAQVTVTYGVA